MAGGAGPIKCRPITRALNSRTEMRPLIRGSLRVKLAINSALRYVAASRSPPREVDSRLHHRRVRPNF